jgi:chaperonin GroES
MHDDTDGKIIWSVGSGASPTIRVVLGDESVELLSDYVLVKPDDFADKSPGGILLPDTLQRELPEMGVCVGVGPGKHSHMGYFVKTVVKSGDRILFKKNYVLFEFRVRGILYLVMSEDSVVGILRKMGDGAAE